MNGDICLYPSFKMGSRDSYDNDDGMVWYGVGVVGCWCGYSILSLSTANTYLTTIQYMLIEWIKYSSSMHLVWLHFPQLFQIN